MQDNTLRLRSGWTPAWWAACLLLLGGCGQVSDDAFASDLPTAGIRNVLRLATTTSTRDSGLLDELLPVFERRHSCRVDVIAVGSGAALKLGEAGDVDVLVVHAPAAELAFMQGRHGMRHETFMFNYFVILGPPDDPAGIRGVDPVTCLQRIAKGKHAFLSRGDDSGTHRRELQLWRDADQQDVPAAAWDRYFESGQGMGPSLVMADELQAYLLADMGTYLRFADRIELTPLSVPTELLKNPYSVISVSPAKHPDINAALADAFIDFLLSEETQYRIAAYHVSERSLFTPSRFTQKH